MKNTENTKFREREQFSMNTKIVFSLLSKTVIKNSFKKREPNKLIFTILIFFKILVTKLVKTQLVCYPIGKIMLMVY